MSTGGVIMPYSTAHMESACQINEDKVIHPFAFRTHTHSLGKSRFITFITCIRRLVARLMHHNIIDNSFSCTKIFSFTVSKIFDGFFFDIMFFVIYIFVSRRLIVAVSVSFSGQVVSGYRVRKNENGKQEWLLIGKQDPQLPQMFYPAMNRMEIKKGDTLVSYIFFFLLTPKRMKVASHY
jgi:hypothetical protein